MTAFTVLPELQEIANDWGDIFVPDDVKPGMVLIRRGRIRAHNPERVVECVLVAENNDGIDVSLYSREDDQPWRFHSGLMCPSQRMKLALMSVIGVVP